ncbi:hypothetical protein ACIBG8_05010 [Nonomuraea sp. NPDC050556]|uniref:hypothetical protein n=1 Tax=Nonomuraea sp. NPDC050556 TaxID=3364369 RepID=UPI0037AF9491
MTTPHTPSAVAIADGLVRRGRDLAEAPGGVLSIFSGPAQVELRAPGLPGDPLAWAILAHEPSLLLELRDPHNVTSFKVELDGKDGDVLADEIAARVDGLLGSGVSTHTPHAALLWPPEWDEIGWERPTRDIHATIRAARLPGRTAWTRHDGVKLAIGTGAQQTGTVPACPPGTVLARQGDGLVVRTGDGALVVSGLRDLIGPVSPDTVPVGARLGGDPAAELIELRARVRDLEQVVGRLAHGTDLLGIPRTREP